MKQKFLLSGLLLMSVISVTAQVPSPRYGHSVCKIDSVYYIFGGALLDDNKKSTKAQPRDDLYRYNPENGFTKISTSLVSGSAPIPGMCGHTAITQNGKMYIFDGVRSETTNASTYIFDPHGQTWEEKNVFPYGSVMYVSNGTRETANEGYSTFAGGYNPFTNSASNECWTYNFGSESWSENASMGFGGRYASASAVIGNKLYVFGGMSDNGPSQSSFVYDIINNMWSWIYPTGFDINPIYGMITAQLGNSFFICGGGMWSGKKSTMEETNFSTSLYEFQVDTLTNNVNIVKRADGLPTSLFGAGWLDVENSDTLMYMFGGIESITSTGDTALTNNFYRYNITDDLVQQYDIVNNTWGELQSSINETEFDKNTNLQVYPNPATSEISFALPNNEIIESIKIYNQNGQLLKQIIKPNAEKINVSDLKTGLYFIRTDTDTNRYLSKLIKE